MDETKPVLVFLAHDRWSKDATIDGLVAELQDLIDKDYKDSEYNAIVMSGRDDFNDHAVTLGGYSPWALDVVERYDVFVRPSTEKEYLGKPSADMAEGFINSNKAVWFWNVDTSDILPCTELEDGPMKKGKRDWANYARLPEAQ